MYIQRELEAKIKPFLSRREALAITGPRQAGKTTFINHLKGEFERAGKKVKFITFEKKGDLDLFSNSIEDFKALAQNYDCVIVDEFQYAGDAGQKLKYLYDTTKVKFIVSGSSSLELTFQTGKYMVGRLLDFELAPFSFGEYLSAAEPELGALRAQKMKSADLFEFDPAGGFGDEITRRLSNALEDYIVWGGYPACVLSKTDLEKQKILEGIVEKYLLQDIKDLLGLATGDELMKIARLLALQIGNLVNFSELSDISGLAHKEVLKHINILEKTFILNLIRPFFVNRRTELVKNPKSYFVDLGVRNFLVSDFRRLEDRNDAGAVMENYARNMLAAKELKLNYWRTKSKAEVDFVAEFSGNTYPIEVKYGSKKIIGKSYYSFLERFNPKTGVILTRDYSGEETIGKTKVKFIPLCYF